MAFVVLKKVALQKHHVQPGRTRHSYLNATGHQDFPQFVRLEIAQHPEDSGFYLLHISQNGQVADTYHQTLEEAFHQAEFEFGVRADEWSDAANTAKLVIN